MSTTATKTSVQDQEAKHILQVYKRMPVVFERGEGSRLYTGEGDSYLDFISGVGVASLGHGHKALADALSAQAHTLLHTSNLFFHPLQAEVATRLAARTGLDRAFFCNSGAEAVETCLKFARRYWHTQGATGRTKYVAFKQSFHGRSMGALSVTWDDHYRAPFAPLVPNVVFADPADVAGLDALVDDTTAAIIVEPLQGEGGVRPIPQAMADAIEAACTRTGALLITDEVQSGSGRTGRFLYGQTLGLTPDLVALGKALGAGVPVGVAMFTDAVAAAASPGDHGSTYGGNLLACRAALVFLEALASPALAASMAAASDQLFSGLAAMKRRRPVIRDVRGAGLMVGIELSFEAGPVVTAAFERNLLINRTSSTVVRLLPPYTITTADVDAALQLLEDAIVAAEGARQ
ncbi:MAG: acetylornithine/succinylornithine family transaminase [Acidobacteria bacterium]|jgi:acetylornithine/N-succinyldiaminopimelate aminotransferase|nr:acetylornithine/succinylornithine family transaminase [Acidobacteriota bacterium]